MFTRFTILINKWAKEKKDRTFLKKNKTKEKQNSATKMISVDLKRTTFPMKLKRHGESFEKHIKKENCKKKI